jgi:diguanylate cyclase (GGDEF)-like protein
VLVVDRDASLLAECESALDGNGYEIVTASSGAQALAAVAGGTIDVALIDICLPDISGIALTRHLARTTSAGVILMTEDESGCTHESAVGEGAVDFITKPIRREELHRRVERARETRRAAAANERLIGNLERMVIRDELTHVFNFRHFRSQLQSGVHRSQRYERPLSLILVDADHFKSLNDRFGHLQGDRALAGLAQVIHRSVRTSDDVFRYGGDEFAALLPETTLVDAERLAERVRHAVETTPLAPGHTLTVSIGVAERCTPDTPEDLVGYADAALYRSKHRGGNRVSLAAHSRRGHAADRDAPEPGRLGSLAKLRRPAPVDQRGFARNSSSTSE